VTNKILSAVLRTGQRFGLGYVIEVLTGEGTKKVRERGHDQLSVFGIVTDFSGDELKQIMTGLVQKQFLTKNEGEYATYRVGEMGVKFLKNKESITLFKPITTIAAAPKKKGALDYDQTLFEKLRVLRKSLADERGVPPFVIFGDTTLQEMAAYYPQTEASLNRITGVGETKLAQFGPAFLEAITAHATHHGLAEKPVPHTRSNIKKMQRTSGQTVRDNSIYSETRELIERGLSLDEVANQKGVTVGTIINHIEKLLDGGQTVNLESVRPAPEKYLKITEAFENYGTASLSTVRQALGEEYSFDEIRLARILLTKSMN
jgi:ATP-dependent DNA helicase RecQ